MAFNVIQSAIVKKAHQRKNELLDAFITYVFTKAPDKAVFFGEGQATFTSRKQYIIKTSSTNVAWLKKPNTQVQIGKTIPALYELAGGNLRSRIGVYTILFQVSKLKSASTSQDAVSTKQQELASNFAFEKGFSNTSASVEDLSKIYPKMDDAWYQSFMQQVLVLKEWWSKSKVGIGFERDGDLMNACTAAAKRFGYSNKDDFNPVDVWAYKKSKYTEIVDKMNLAESADHYNELLRAWTKDRTCVPISLKKTGKVGRVEESNMRGKVNKAVLQDKKFTNLNCFFELLPGQALFRTNESSFTIDNNIAGQVRIMGTVSPNTTVQSELIPRGGSVSRLGKIPVAKLRMYFNDSREEYPKSRNIPKTWEDFLSEKSKWTRIFTDAKVAHVNMGITTVKQFIEVMKKMYGNTSFAGQVGVNTKLQSLLYIAGIGNMIKAGKGTEVATGMYYGAKKEGANQGPFIKIY